MLGTIAAKQIILVATHKALIIHGELLIVRVKSLNITK